MVDTGCLGRIDGDTPLLKVQIGIRLGCAKIVGDHEDLFGPGLFEGAVQISAERVVANHGLHTLALQRAVGRPSGAVYVKPRLHQRPADIAPHLAGGIENQHFFRSHSESFAPNEELKSKTRLHVIYRPDDAVGWNVFYGGNGGPA